MPRWLDLTSPAMSSTASGTTPSRQDRQIKLLFPDRPLAVKPLATNPPVTVPGLLPGTRRNGCAEPSRSGGTGWNVQNFDLPRHQKWALVRHAGRSWRRPDRPGGTGARLPPEGVTARLF